MSYMGPVFMGLTVSGRREGTQATWERILMQFVITFTEYVRWARHWVTGFVRVLLLKPHNVP